MLGTAGLRFLVGRQSAQTGELAMYEKHFRLTRRPFASTVEALAYYPVTCQEQARQQLAAAVQDQESIALLTGEPGTGKTLVALRLIEELESQRRTAWLTNT